MSLACVEGFGHLSDRRDDLLGLGKAQDGRNACRAGMVLFRG